MVKLLIENPGIRLLEPAWLYPTRSELGMSDIPKNDSQLLIYGPKILFAGGSGLLGRHMQEVEPTWLYPTRSDLDLSDPRQIDTWLRVHGPVSCVVYAASLVGGLHYNEDNNLSMMTGKYGS